MLEEDKIVQDIFNGLMNMKKCTEKPKWCDLRGKLLHRSLKLLKVDWEHRQIFTTLEIIT